LSTSRVLILGGSVAGLAAALSLKHSGRQVVIVERDPPPPELSPERAFEEWERSGVPQFRHAHILLARLQTELRDHHPELLAELEHAGITRSRLDEMLPPTQLGRVPPDPSDADLCHLWGRRATFEYVLRRHVGRLPHVRFEHEAQVIGLCSEQTGDGVRITGVEISRGGVRETLHAELIVDATGANSKVAEWLEALGVVVSRELHASRYAYFCRHYLLRDPERSPPRRGTGANLDYLWYGLFCAEHGHFSIALACPSDETALIASLRRSEGFDAACRQLPLLAPWIEAAGSPGKVLGAGKLANRWHKYGGQGGPELIGLIALGDSHLHTNPMYGRGCSSAFIQARVLSETLAASEDPHAQARQYYARTWQLIRPHFDSAVFADRMFLGRATQQRGLPLRWLDRTINRLYDRIWMPALLHSPLIAREMIKVMEMRELSTPWTRLRVVGAVLHSVLSRVLGARVASLPAYGPARGELLHTLSSLTEPAERAERSAETAA
jgi:2-polyprenyl-6-methoxyphenol hydroxylase-like FAD-dependent oxidoreductase